MFNWRIIIKNRNQYTQLIVGENDFGSLYKEQSLDWDYLKNSKTQAISITSDGTGFELTDVNKNKRVHPVLYLKTDVRIASGSGTNSSPYVLTR